MKMHDVKVFGYGEFAKEIVSQVNDAYRSVSVYTLDNKSLEEVKGTGSEAHIFDLGDNWDEFNTLNLEETLFICALDDDADNVFLTISLRDQFPQARLIGIASTHEHASKLRLAGAQKVISKLQATADMIIDVLERPVVTEILNDILDEETILKSMQLTLSSTTKLLGQRLETVSHNIENSLIVLAVVDHNMKTQFLFTAKGSKHILQEGDILVLIGYDEELEKFKRSVL